MKKTVVVTGASKGIGLCIAKLFLQNDYNVVGCYNNTIPEDFGALMIKADVTDETQVEQMVKKAISAFGSIDVLINNAGIALPLKVITDVTAEEWDNIFNVNVKGTFNVTKKILPVMIKNQCGSIINISSMWGQIGGSCEVCYSASKGAIIAFTKALAKEVGLSNIKVNCVCPGVIDTQMNNGLDLSYIKEDTPLNKIGCTLDIAKLCLYLATDGFITGQIIGSNGGYVI
ncbi:MAG: SDR family oxidoreductase [Oscillospiraceae bacterium]